jgi:hypothetical protein
MHALLLSGTPALFLEYGLSDICELLVASWRLPLWRVNGRWTLVSVSCEIHINPSQVLGAIEPRDRMDMHVLLAVGC